MRRILVIGQAPPAVKQKVPYDTTMLYDWLAEVGIDKNEAQNLFEWEAMYDKFPGRDDQGNHLVPTEAQMNEHWDNILETKVQDAEKVWLLGKVASDFFFSKPKTWSCNLDILETIHPSPRNKGLYKRNKVDILTRIHLFLKN